MNILLAIVLGLVLQAIFNTALLIYVVFALVMAVLSLWERRFLYLLFVALSAVNLILHEPGEIEYGARELTFSGIVIGTDQYEHHAKLLLHVDRICCGHDTIEHRFRAEHYTFKQDVFLGKRLTIKGRLKPSRHAYRPSILSGTIVSASVARHVLGAVFHPLRNYIDARLRGSFKDEQYLIASGLILGGSGRLGSELRDVFSRAGIMHILAVSGLHVGFVALFLGMLLLFIPIDQRLKFILIMIGLFVYAGVTGFRPSVCRASLMAFLFGLAGILQRNVDHIHILNIAALTFLIVSPLLIFDVGAQLSFAAVYGILYLYPRIDELLIKKVRGRYLRSVLRMMSVSFSAQLFVAPLLVFYFQRIPLYAVLTNLLVVPLAAVIICLLFIGLLAGAFCTTIVNVISLPVSILINALIVLSRFFAGMPGSSVQIMISPLFIMPLYVLVWKPARRWLVWIAIVLFAAYSIASSVKCLTVHVAAEGVLLTIPHGERILISGKKLSVLKSFLERDGGKEVDYLVGPDKDLTVKKEYIEMPGKLEAKHLSIGDLEIHIAKSVSILFRGVDIEYDRIAQEMQEGEIVCILTNGKKNQVLFLPLNLSVIERMILDSRLIIARLRLLF